MTEASPSDIAYGLLTGIGGVPAFNKWRVENPDIELDWRSRNFGGMNLQGIKIGKVDLRGANFDSIREHGDQTIQHTNLEGVDLRQANLGFDSRLLLAHPLNELIYPGPLKLEGNTRFWRANMKGVKLPEWCYDLYLRGAKINEAELRNVNLIRCNLRGTSFEDSDIGGMKVWYSPDANKLNLNNTRTDINTAFRCLVYDENSKPRCSRDLRENIEGAQITRRQLTTGVGVLALTGMGVAGTAAKKALSILRDRPPVRSGKMQADVPKKALTSAQQVTLLQSMDRYDHALEEATKGNVVDLGEPTPPNERELLAEAPYNAIVLGNSLGGQMVKVKQGNAAIFLPQANIKTKNITLENATEPVNLVIGQDICEKLSEAKVVHQEGTNRWEIHYKTDSRRDYEHHLIIEGAAKGVRLSVMLPYGEIKPLVSKDPAPGTISLSNQLLNNLNEHVPKTIFENMIPHMALGVPLSVTLPKLKTAYDEAVRKGDQAGQKAMKGLLRVAAMRDRSLGTAFEAAVERSKDINPEVIEGYRKR